MFNVTNNHGNANQNHNEILSHTCQGRIVLTKIK
jgi:hypothetical protein